MPPQTRQTHKNTSERDNSSLSKAPVDNQYVTLDTFNDMVKEIWSIQSLIREQAVDKPIHNIESTPDDSDATSSSTVTNDGNIHKGILKSIYDGIPQYSGDGDIQTLLDFIDKVDDYLVIADNAHSMEIPLITMKLMGTASLLWRHHKRIHDTSSPHRIQTWNGLRKLLMQNKVTKEHERYILSQLDILKQKESVQKYNNEFERYAMQLLNLPLTIEMHYYLKGLKIEIRQLIESNELNLTDMTTLKNACIRQDHITSLPLSSANTRNNNLNEGNVALTASNIRGRYNRCGGSSRKGNANRRGGSIVNNHNQNVQNTSESNDSKDNDIQRRYTPRGAYRGNSTPYCYVCSRTGHTTKQCYAVKDAIERHNRDKGKTASTSSVRTLYL